MPTVGTPWACRSRTAEKTVAAHDRHQDGRKPAREPRQHHQDGQDAQTDEQRRHDGPVESDEEGLDFGTEALGVGRESEELRQLPDDDHEGETVHVPDLDLVRQEVGDESQLRDAESDLDQSDDQGQHAGQRDLSVHVPPGTRRGSRAAKIIGEMDESGPSTRIREGPKTAYPTRQPIVA